jgi:uncharacterized membrane protein
MNDVLLLIMVGFYLMAGVMHFVKPRVYLRMMPGWLPFPMPLVYVSGVVEILAGILLIFPYTRPAGAWLTIALLIAVFPANIQMAINFGRKPHRFFWLTLLRLPLQLVLIWWAWLYTR